MGDISTRGKGKALKMKKGGKASKEFMGLAPKDKGRRKKRTDGAMKRRAEEASMRELRYPTSKPKRRRPERPERPEREFRPMPMPMPRPERPNMKPMPYKKPKLPKDIEKYFMKTPRRVTPLKDGGEMKFGAAADVNKIKEGLKSLGSVGAGVGAGKLYDSIKKLKPTGRINIDDIKRTLESMKKAKKIDMSPGRRKAMTGSETGKTRGEKLAESLKNRPPMKKPKAVRRQMVKKASKRLI
jgi:hypothetical protein